MSTYRIVAAPKHASMVEYDCQLCGCESLKRPVFLQGPAGAVLAAGTGCASVALYGRRDPKLARRVRNEADSAATAAKLLERGRNERAAFYRLAIEWFAAGEDAKLVQVRRTYHLSGGYSVLGPFDAWLESVAATGMISPDDDR